MDHCMTVRAHRDQILDRVHFIFVADGPDGNNVVDMNELFTERAVDVLEIEAAGCTIKSVMMDVGIPRLRAPLESVD